MGSEKERQSPYRSKLHTMQIVCIYIQKQDEQEAYNVRLHSGRAPDAKIQKGAVALNGAAALLREPTHR